MVGEIKRQQAFFNHHAQADATEGTERRGSDYAAYRAKLQTDQLQHLAVENARIFERYEHDYREWRLQCPGRRMAPPDTMTPDVRGPKCTASPERHSMVRLPCRRGPGARSDVAFHSSRRRPEHRYRAWDGS